MSPRILILDNDRSMTATVAQLVSYFGYEPIECHHPQEALNLLLSESFQALITDYQMPAMTGLELMRHLRDQGCRIAAVLMSGDVDAIDRTLARQLEIEAILAKPFDLFEFKDALQTALFSHRALYSTECASL